MMATAGGGRGRWLGLCVGRAAKPRQPGPARGGSYDSSIKLWCLESKAEVAVLRGHRNWVNALAPLPEWGWLASGSGDNTI
jgi:WD40 repeat protein